MEDFACGPGANDNVERVTKTSELAAPAYRFASALHLFFGIVKGPQ